MNLLQKLKSNSTIDLTDVLDDSTIYNEKDQIQTKIPALNIALGGSLKGGLTPGVTMFAGPSKHFKSLFSLMLAKAYMDKYPDAVMLFYDNEFGTPKSYFKWLNIDTKRILHCPLTDIEQLKFDIINQLKEINRGDKVCIVIDSIGNIASKKEIEDALEQKSAADMTRAKQLKSVFRMVTPHLRIKDIPLIVVNHTYKEQALYPKDIVSGGTGSYYSADNLFIVGRQQDKDGTEIVGYNFILNVEKSRYVKEKSKITINVTHENGISLWSGLLDIALETGHVIKPKKGYYARCNPETGVIDDKEYREAETNNEEFWKPILVMESFDEGIGKMFKLANAQ